MSARPFPLDHGQPSPTPRIAVVMPCFRVRRHVLDVLRRIGPECAAVYVVDDKCPEGSGEHVARECRDPRVRVAFHEENQGVGGATLTGYRLALEGGATVIVKVDGDGQMDPELIPRLVRVVLQGEADYAKGNRFFHLEGLPRMPLVRLLGNSILSFVSKLSSGYWNVFDPTNGFTAIHARVARVLPFAKLDKGYFFESDLLFRLNTLGAVVVDVPMPVRYADEQSSLNVGRSAAEFAVKHAGNFVKRILYNYYWRNFHIASVELLAGVALLVFGVAVGSYHWWVNAHSAVFTSSGTVMLAALPVIVGIQLLLAFLNFDVQSVPQKALHPRLPDAGGDEPPER
jgi:glycosyltransferase involved in cell wall biosynthesis